MTHIILGMLIEIGVQAVLLGVALWIMIKVQSLDYNFPGLLGTAILVSTGERILDLILGHYLGIYLASTISTPIVIAALFICVSKVTQADRVDVMFTIAVGYALMFGMNLWLFSAMLGDLRPDAGTAREYEPETPPETNVVNQVTTITNPPTTTTNLPATNAPAEESSEQNPTNPPAKVSNLVSLKGVTRNASKSSATIQAGAKTYTVFLGDLIVAQTPNGPVSVRFKELGDNWVLLIINGQETKLPIY